MYDIIVCVVQKYIYFRAADVHRTRVKYIYFGADAYVMASSVYILLHVKVYTIEGVYTINDASHKVYILSRLHTLRWYESIYL